MIFEFHDIKCGEEENKISRHKEQVCKTFRVAHYKD